MTDSTKPSAARDYACPRCKTGVIAYAQTFSGVSKHKKSSPCSQCGYRYTAEWYRVGQRTWEISPPGWHPMTAPPGSDLANKLEKRARGTWNTSYRLDSVTVLDQMYEIGGYSRDEAIKRYNEIKKEEGHQL